MYFFSNYINKIDKKGRVSVPAGFRAVLAKEGAGELYLAPSLHLPCVQGWGPNYFQKVQGILDGMDPFSPERDAYATVLFGETVVLTADGEGRICLPEQLIEQANISHEAAFVGKGDVFEIWEPSALKAHTKQSRKAVSAMFGKAKS